MTSDGETESRVRSHIYSTTTRVPYLPCRTTTRREGERGTRSRRRTRETRAHLYDDMNDSRRASSANKELFRVGKDPPDFSARQSRVSRLFLCAPRGFDAAPPPKPTPDPPPPPPLAVRRRFPELPDASPSPSDAPVSCGAPGARAEFLHGVEEEGTRGASAGGRGGRTRPRRGFRGGHERAVSSLERRRGHRSAAQRRAVFAPTAFAGRSFVRRRRDGWSRFPRLADRAIFFATCAPPAKARWASPPSRSVPARPLVSGGGFPRVSPCRSTRASWRAPGSWRPVWWRWVSRRRRRRLRRGGRALREGGSRDSEGSARVEGGVRDDAPVGALDVARGDPVSDRDGRERVRLAELVLAKQRLPGRRFAVAVVIPPPDATPDDMGPTSRDAGRETSASGRADRVHASVAAPTGLRRDGSGRARTPALDKQVCRKCRNS